MIRLYYLSLFIIFISCNNSEKHPPVAVNKINHPAEVEKEPVIENETEEKFYSDTALIDGNLYYAFSTGPEYTKVFIINENRDTLVNAYEQDEECYVEFNDFNGDGFKDLITHCVGNLPYGDLFLYDLHRKNFIKVKDFSRFNEPKPIKGTIYYYSYHRSGCADADWVSDLFYIKDFKAIQTGHISGIECNDEVNGIFIKKVKGNKVTLLDKLPIDLIYSYENNKWGFIEDYWNKNYKNFIE